jgi:hypothetical protein
VGRINRLRSQSPLDNRSNLIILDRPRPSRPGLIQQPFETTFQEAPSPLANRVLVHAQLCGNDIALDAVGAAQDNPVSLRHRTRHASATDLPLQTLPLLRVQQQWCPQSAAWGAILHPCRRMRKTM